MIQAVIVWQDSDNDEGTFAFNFKSLTLDNIKTIAARFQKEHDVWVKAEAKRNPHKPTKKVP